MVTEKRPTRDFVDLPLADLKIHPLQKEIYTERADWQLDELAADMEKNGQDEPVEVLPDRTIVAGHGRVDAAKLLGWTTIRCWIRRDHDPEPGQPRASRR